MLSNTISSLLLQFLLFAFAMAEETPVGTYDNTWKYGSGGGVVGFIVLILDIIVWGTSQFPFPFCS